MAFQPGVRELKRFFLTVGIDPGNNPVGAQQHQEAHQRLIQARRRGHAHVAQRDQPPVYVCVDDVRHGIQSAGVLGDRIEQAEVTPEDGAHGHDERNADDEAQVRQGDVARLLELGGAVQYRRLVVVVGDAGDDGQIQHGVVAHALPGVDEHQQRRPDVLLLVPVGLALAPQRLDDLVHDAVVPVQEGGHHDGYHGPAEEVGQHVHRLQCLGQPTAGELAEHQRHDDGQDGVHRHEYQIVAHGVAGDGPGVGGGEEVFEVLQAHQGGAEDALGGVEILEGHHQAEHGRIAEHHQEHDGGQRHDIQCEILPPEESSFLAPDCAVCR